MWRVRQEPRPSPSRRVLLSDLTDAQWKVVEPLLVVSSKRGPKHGADLRHVVDAMLYISHTGCQWRFLPEEFGPWTRALSELHASSRRALGR